MFNNRLQAIGARSLLPPLPSAIEPVVVINDHDYLLNDLLPPEWRIKSIAAMNDEGMILASVNRVLDSSGAPIAPGAQVSSVVILLPIDIAPDSGMVGVVGDVIPRVCW